MVCPSGVAVARCKDVPLSCTCSPHSVPGLGLLTLLFWAYLHVNASSHIRGKSLTILLYLSCQATTAIFLDVSKSLALPQPGFYAISMPFYKSFLRASIQNSSYCLNYLIPPCHQLPRNETRDSIVATSQWVILLFFFIAKDVFFFICYR